MNSCLRAAGYGYRERVPPPQLGKVPTAYIESKSLEVLIICFDGFIPFGMLVRQCLIR